MPNTDTPRQFVVGFELAAAQQAPLEDGEEQLDGVTLIFDGGGTVWPGLLARDDHPAHGLWESVHHLVSGACGYCADAFGVAHALDVKGVRSRRFDHGRKGPHRSTHEPAIAHRTNCRQTGDRGASTRRDAR